MNRFAILVIESVIAGLFYNFGQKFLEELWPGETEEK